MNLSQKYKTILFDILEKHFPDCRILLFGSRATGTAQRFSDIDIAIDYGGSVLPPKKLADAKQNFIESDLPYTVDLIDFNAVDSSFKAKIKKEAINLSDQKFA